MPRYYFDVTDGQTYPDNQGTELPSLEFARREAFGVIGDIIKNKTTWDSQEWIVDIADAAGVTLLTLRFDLHESKPTAA